MEPRLTCCALRLMDVSFCRLGVTVRVSVVRIRVRVSIRLELGLGCHIGVRVWEEWPYRRRREDLTSEMK